jgi:signal transduction histidine kinase
MSDTTAKYEALKSLLVAVGAGTATDLNAVLESVCAAVGLAGSAVVSEPYEGDPEALAGTDWAQQAVARYASALWRRLVADHEVESAFMQLAPEGRALSFFAYPLRQGDRVTGAVMGLAEGRRNLATEEDFLLALATALRLAQAVDRGEAEPSADAGAELAEAVEKARQAAILEAAIAVNHEVNNPLTAVLGNTQLLLLQADALDAKTKKRLQDIERSALRIKEVTQKLLKKGPLGTTEYPGGLRMLDLSDSDSETDQSAPDDTD